MRVQCFLCEHEDEGFCFKKKRNGKPIKIKPKKRRACKMYTEEAGRVLADFRKREAHRAALRNQEIRRARVEQTVQEAQQQLGDRAKIVRPQE